MPALKLMVIFAAEKHRFSKSIECEVFERFGHSNRREDLRGRDDDIEGIKWEHIINLAINDKILRRVTGGNQGEGFVVVALVGNFSYKYHI